MNPAKLPQSHQNILKLEKLLKTKPETYWIEKGRRRALKLFREMAERVPAYKDFLKKNKIDPVQIRSFRDFSKVPIVDKDNYLKKYSLQDLCWDGKFAKSSWDISATSGSTGEPFYFPRTQEQDLQYALIAELYLRTNFSIHKKTTLYVNAFPLGIWIGGLFTYAAIKTVANRGGYNLSIINPGIDKKKIIEVISKFGKDFDQVIIGCYGPFLKDALDDGIRKGVKWKDYNLKFIFSAEGFTEGFRDYIANISGIKNQYLDTLNHYGTVDQGTHSYETPLSILIRKNTVKNKDLFDRVFPVNQKKLPTLTQYDPTIFFFECENKILLCSAYSGIPLFRYNLKDRGGIISFSEIKRKFNESKINLKEEILNGGIQDTIWQLPFVYLYERIDFSVSLYAFQIYPSTVRKALFQSKIQKYCTGKFTMRVDFDKKQNQYFEVNIELKGGKKQTKTFEKYVVKTITNALLKEKSEYRYTYSKNPARVIPRVVFWPYEDPIHFRPGGKQKWVK